MTTSAPALVECYAWTDEKDVRHYLPVSACGHSRARSTWSPCDREYLAELIQQETGLEALPHRLSSNFFALERMGGEFSIVHETPAPAAPVELPPVPSVGSVSWGTHRNQDLLPRFLDVLEEFAPDDARDFCRVNLVGIVSAIDNGEELAEWVSSTVLELFDLLSAIAPPYCYFGASEGDGADFGFWVCRESVQYARESDELESGDETPDGPTESGEFLTVSDHGNLELYRWNGAAWESVWGIV